LAKRLASFDWRTSSAPDLSASERTVRAGFRGSGGYKALRGHLLLHLEAGAEPYRSLAGEAIEILGLRD
jgi:hypothetical protein